MAMERIVAASPWKTRIGMIGADYVPARHLRPGEMYTAPIVYTLMKKGAQFHDEAAGNVVQGLARILDATGDTVHIARSDRNGLAILEVHGDTPLVQAKAASASSFSGFEGITISRDPLVHPVPFIDVRTNLVLSDGLPLEEILTSAIDGLSDSQRFDVATLFQQALPLRQAIRG